MRHAPSSGSIRHALFALLLLMLPQTAHAAPIAMVTDLQGKGALTAGAARSPLALLADVEPGAQIELDAGARMVVLYLDGSGEYVFSGPALVAFRGAQPEVLKGAAAQKRIVLAGKAGSEVRIKPVGLAQGALVMRSAGPRSRIRLVNPSGTRTAETRPEFRWQDEQQGLTYHFEFSDDTGRTLRDGRARNFGAAPRFHDAHRRHALYVDRFGAFCGRPQIFEHGRFQRRAGKRARTSRVRQAGARRAIFRSGGLRCMARAARAEGRSAQSVARAFDRAAG